MNKVSRLSQMMPRSVSLIRVNRSRWPTHCIAATPALPSGLRVYARLCGWTLARAHARSGDRIALAAYLGSSGTFAQAIADFAEAYADQNERDYAALQAAVKDGRAQTTTDI